jgi:Leucine-rich repeat (LRR) protein
LLFNLLCSNNQLTSLDVSNNIDSLTILYCEENQLTSLDVSANTALTDLKCRGNKFDCDALKKKIGLD